MAGAFCFSFRLPAGKHFHHLSTPCGQLSTYAQLMHSYHSHLIGAFQVQTYVLRVFPSASLPGIQCSYSIDMHYINKALGHFQNKREMDSQMENANTIRYITGRTYDCAQVLEITITGRSTDEFGLETIQATFTDASRHISGKCEALVFNDGIGAAVLCAYDAGRYTAI